MSVEVWAWLTIRGLEGASDGPDNPNLEQLVLGMTVAGSVRSVIIVVSRGISVGIAPRVADVLHLPRGEPNQKTKIPGEDESEVILPALSRVF